MILLIVMIKRSTQIWSSLGSQGFLIKGSMMSVKGWKNMRVEANLHRKVMAQRIIVSLHVSGERVLSLNLYLQVWFNIS